MEKRIKEVEESEQCKRSWKYLEGESRRLDANMCGTRCERGCWIQPGKCSTQIRGNPKENRTG